MTTSKGRTKHEFSKGVPVGRRGVGRPVRGRLGRGRPRALSHGLHHRRHAHEPALCDLRAGGRHARQGWARGPSARGRALGVASRLLLPQPGGRGRLPPLARGRGPLCRDGLQGLPHVHRLESPVSHGHRDQAQPRGRRVLPRDVRVHAEQGHRAAGHAPALRHAARARGGVRRLGEPRAHRPLRALL